MKRSVKSSEGVGVASKAQTLETKYTLFSGIRHSSVLAKSCRSKRWYQSSTQRTHSKRSWRLPKEFWTWIAISSCYPMSLTLN